MKAIKPCIRLIEGVRGNKYHVVITKDGNPFRKSYDTLEEAEEVVLDIRKHTKVKNNDYPLNLIELLFANDEKIDIRYVENNFDENIEYVLDTLSDREASVIRRRFIDGYTLEALALQDNITRERVRQIEAKAIRKMRIPARLSYLKYGTELSELRDDINKLKHELLIKKEALLYKLANPELIEITEEDVAGAKTLESMDFTVRTYNCLRRGGITKLADLLSKSEDDLLRLRGLGNKGLKEIHYKLDEIGLKIKKND